MITQGLLALPEIDVLIDKDYISFGRTILRATDVEKHFNDADFIFAADDNDLAVSKKYDLNGLKSKLIWYDFKDSQSIDHAMLDKCLIYFKRSVVTANRSLILHNRIHPIDYGAMNEYYLEETERSVSIGCFFNDPNQHRRQQVTSELKKANIPNSFIGNTCSTGKIARRAIEHPLDGNCFYEYLQMLHRTKIIFTAFPQNPDGDSRTWEAFASGALVFRDRTFIPHSHPLINKEHFFEYDANDIKSIQEAIKTAKDLLKDDDARTRIARNGSEFVKTHHRSVNRVKGMLYLATEHVRKNTI